MIVYRNQYFFLPSSPSDWVVEPSIEGSTFQSESEDENFLKYIYLKKMTLLSFPALLPLIYKYIHIYMYIYKYIEALALGV